MSIRFVADAVPVELERVMRQAFDAETPIIPKAVTTRIRQTTPFIPDDETLRQYAAVLENQANDSMRLVNVTFDGYDYIYAVERPDGMAGDRVQVRTPRGTLRSAKSVDDKYPGIAILRIDETGTERGACVFSYDPESDRLTLQIWSPDDPDGEPIRTIDMTGGTNK